MKGTWILSSLVKETCSPVEPWISTPCTPDLARYRTCFLLASMSTSCAGVSLKIVMVGTWMPASGLREGFGCILSWKWEPRCIHEFLIKALGRSLPSRDPHLVGRRPVIAEIGKFMFCQLILVTREGPNILCMFSHIHYPGKLLWISLESHIVTLDQCRSWLPVVPRMSEEMSEEYLDADLNCVLGMSNYLYLP